MNRLTVPPPAPTHDAYHRPPFLRFPTALPELPESAPLPPGTTAAALSAQLHATADALTCLLKIAQRLTRAALHEGALLPSDADALAAATEWYALHVDPLLEAGWRRSPWERRFFDLSYAVDILSDHLHEWQAVADQIRRVTALHDQVGTRLERTMIAFAKGAACRPIGRSTTR